ncbi:MAG: tRNA uridine-5-carboxymethylaminomethyl(34) synthesis GTPase MnmE, partial [Oscillospiraceae bacterium]|nr:tRNA uridine-5-carboxymethylaminomethyl(34) synthesis GTPase MnmE [Oscillospiraceae bacterium]
MADIIAAISTALQPSGIGVIRLSGEGCDRLAAKVLRPVHGQDFGNSVPRKLILCDLYDRNGRIMDRILAVRTPGPNSYTGEDTAELQCHGSPAVLTEALAHLFALGARQAQPGEFTKRAFLNGRMDLTAAEAVIDLIEAETADAAANAAGQVGGALLRRLEPV